MSRVEKEKGIEPWEADDAQDDPFPPLAPRATTDTSHDKAIDAALRDYCERRRAEGK